MENVVTLGEIFAKAQDSLTPSFNQVKFETDVDNLSKAETENLLGTIQAEIIKGGDYDMLTEMRSIALDHITDIEKAVYTDNPLNRKLGRVGQEYGGRGSRGGKTDDEHQSEWSGLSRKNKKEEKNKYVDDYKTQIMRRYDVDEKTAKKNAIKLTELVGKMDAGTLDFGEGNKQMKAIWDSMKDKRNEEDKRKIEKYNEVYDEDFKDDLKYFLGNQGILGALKEVEGVKVGSVNDKGEIWVPSHNKTKDGGYAGKWMSKKEIEDGANRHRAYNGDYKLTSEQKKAWPIGAKFTDAKGREFKITKHDSSRGRIKLSHVTDDGKKRTVFLNGHDLKNGLHPNFTTGFPEIDKKLRKVYDNAHKE